MPFFLSNSFIAICVSLSIAVCFFRFAAMSHCIACSFVIVVSI